MMTPEGQIGSQVFFCSIFTARKQSLGQGNNFTPVCHSVHGGGRGTSPPPGQTTPPGLCTPRTMYPLGLHTPRLHTPLGLHTPPDYVPPLGLRPPLPGLRTPPPVDGLCAGGTHPTGMHSCLFCNNNLNVSPFK